MSGEGRFWTYLRPYLQRWGLDPMRMENSLRGGTPDVNYSRGWIELKALDDWPPGQAVNWNEAFRKREAQRPWLYRRWTHGGPAWVLLRVGLDMFLLSGFDALHLRDTWPRSMISQVACWSGTRPDDELQQWLTWDDGNLPAHARARLYRLRCGCSPSKLAADLGWDWVRVLAAERETRSPDTYDLIDHWVR